MLINEIAKAAGVGVETIRFYERKGLIKQPARPVSGGFRAYPQDAVSRVRFIREAKELGFSLREIDELLSLKSDPKTDCRSVRDRALNKRNEVEDKIKKLKALQKTLTTLIDGCPGKGPATFCSILVALERADSTEQNTRASDFKSEPL